MRLLLTGAADVELAELQEVATKSGKLHYVVSEEFPSTYDPDTYGPVTRKTMLRRINRAEILSVLENHSDILVVAKGNNLHTIAWAFHACFILFKSDDLRIYTQEKYLGYEHKAYSINNQTDYAASKICNYE